MFYKQTLNSLLSAGLMPPLFSGQFQAQGGGMPWWVWVLIIVVVLALVWWWLRGRPEESATPVAQLEPAGAPLMAEAAVAEAAPPAEPVAPDDLTIIEGIGPKISGVLQTAGITTFAQLAETEISRLEQIIEEAGLGRLANPETWPEQARLAAAGNWEELETLQGQLKGGRRA